MYSGGREDGLRLHNYYPALSILEEGRRRSDREERKVQ